MPLRGAGIHYVKLYYMLIIGFSLIRQLNCHSFCCWYFGFYEKLQFPGSYDVRIIFFDEFLHIRKHEMIHVSMSEQNKIDLFKS